MQSRTKVLSKKQLKQLSNPDKISEVAHLVHVSDTTTGIIRLGNKGNYIYKYRNKTITDIRVLERIKRIVIPPAWRDVWICPKANGHIQATGIDAANRKQYRYHPSWNLLRNHTKFSHLYDFGLSLPAIRERINKDLSLPGLGLHKVLAAAVSIMQCTCIRVGNNMYEKLYGSFGLTTLKDEHVKINGSNVRFSFKGKKGIYHSLSLKSKKLAHIIRQCRDIPGKELFQYYDDNHVRHTIDSGMLNNYIKEISGNNFTAKDFRTWAGTLEALKFFKESDMPETETAMKKKIVEAMDIVAEQLGNTRTVCKKYYVHPIVIECFSANTLHKYLPPANGDCDLNNGLNEDEVHLLQILKKAPYQVEL